MSGVAQADPETLMVGIGASAGGSQPLGVVLAGLGEATGMAVLVVMHVGEGDADLLAEVLAEQTSLSVEVVRSRTKVSSRRLYIAPGSHDLTLEEGFLVPVRRSSRDVPATPIDRFFQSLAKSRGSDAVGVVLSGAGGDGTLGLKAIEEAGGMTIAQSPETADHEAMPKNAIAVGVVDHVLEPKAIAEELRAYREHLHGRSATERDTEQREAIVAALPAVADLLQERTRHDFRHYKTNTLVRRIQRRIQVCRVSSVDRYLERLREESSELDALHGELLIGVTQFFRDPDAFAALEETVIGPLMADRRLPVRVWVAGCATGEEAYTLAILFREQMERMDDPPDVQIFATDINARALDHARKAVYSAGITDHMSAERLERFFVKRSQRYHVKKFVRKLCMFSAHNLIGDPPFSRLDLVACRNLLIYLGQHLQRKLIPLFHYALRPRGHLFLGPSENISSHGDLFKMVASKHRIAQRRSVATQGSRLRPRPSPVPEVSPAPQIIDRDPELHQIAERIVVDEFTPEWTIVNDEGRVLSLSEMASRYLQLSGGAFHNNVIRMARPGLRVALKDALARARRERRRVRRDDLVVPSAAAAERVALTVQPMPRLGEDAALYLVVFQAAGDVSPRERAAHAQPSAPLAQIEELERELMGTRRDLEETISHLENANEELKSSNEELVSMNEELQSANEELETSKEEVQTTNDALSRAKTDLENVLRSTEIATLFLDDDQHIRSFTSAVREIYNVMDSDVGRPLWHITHGAVTMPPLPTSDELGEVHGRHETIVETSDGRFFSRRVLPYRDGNEPSQGMVVTFVDITPLRISEERNRTLVDISAQIVWATNARGEVVADSPSWRGFTGQTVDQWLGRGWLDALHPDDRPRVQDAWRECIDNVRPFETEYRVRHISGQHRWTHVRAAPIFEPDGAVREWIGMNADIHERKTTETALATRSLVDGLRADVNEALTLDASDARTPKGACEALAHHPLVRSVTIYAKDESRLERLASCGEDLPQEALRSFAEQLEGADWKCVSADGWLDAPPARSVAIVGYPIRDEGRTVGVVVVWFEGTEHSSLPAELAPVAEPFGHFIQRRRDSLLILESEQRLRLALRSNAIQAFDWNLSDGTVYDSSADEDVASDSNHPPPRKYEDLVADVHPEDREAFRAAIARALESGSYEMELRRGVDEIRWVHERGHVRYRADGHPERLFAVSLDITSQRQVQEARSWLAAIIEHSDDAIIGQALDGTITSFNHGAERLYEYTAEEVVGRPASLLVPEGARGDVSAVLSRVQRGETIEAYEMLGQTKTGQRRVVSLTMSMIRDEAGRGVGVSTIARDITEQRRARDALVNSSRRKDEFLALLGHELRNPLAAVRSAAELLKISHDGDARLARIHGALDRQVTLMVRLVDGLLDLSRMARGKITVEHHTLDLVELLRQMVEDRRLAIEASSMNLVTQFPPGPIWVRGDDVRLVQVFDNLLSNATKFTGSGGQITVTIARRDEGVTVSVRDTGSGIDANIIARIFEPFEQGTQGGGGLGMGLALVKGLVELHDGRVEAQSEGQGHGAELLVWLPESRAPERSDHEDLEPENRRYRILVIEDHLDAAEMLEALLATRGHDVTVLNDGRRALETLRKRHVDVVLCDLGLPKVTGFEVARAVRADPDLKAMPMVAMTGYGQARDREGALTAGFDAYLTKPVEVTALEETLLTLLDRRHD